MFRNPMVHLQEYSSIYSYGTVRFTSITVCSILYSISHTLLATRLLIPTHAKRAVPYHNCIYSCLPAKRLGFETCRRHKKFKKINLGNGHFVGLSRTMILVCSGIILLLGYPLLTH